MFLTAFLAFLTADLAALTTRLVTDFFFGFFAIKFPLAFRFLRFLFLGGFLGGFLRRFISRGLFCSGFLRSFLCFGSGDGLLGFLDVLRDRFHRGGFRCRFSDAFNDGLSGGVRKNGGPAYDKVADYLTDVLLRLFRILVRLLLSIHRTLQNSSVADLPGKGREFAPRRASCLCTN